MGLACAQFSGEVSERAADINMGLCLGKQMNQLLPKRVFRFHVPIVDCVTL